MAGIAVALSGGGHRAALFGLGVLLYLVDAKKNHEVTSIASVSGGSLTNGHVAKSIDYATAGAAEFEPVARRLARQIATRGTLWAAPLTWLYLALLVTTAAAAIVGVWFLPFHLGWRVLLFFAGLLLLAWIASWRGVVCARAFASTLFLARRPTDAAQLGSSLRRPCSVRDRPALGGACVLLGPLRVRLSLRLGSAGRSLAR
ncbi:MAG: hypothetical protein M3546_04465 [Actinomycetota bacterium]|nr:hypothetical protein [Actinomycetota bacterium]